MWQTVSSIVATAGKYQTSPHQETHERHKLIVHEKDAADRVSIAIEWFVPYIPSLGVESTAKDVEACLDNGRNRYKVSKGENVMNNHSQG